MNLVMDAALVLIAAGAAIAAMLFVRRTAPDGGYFHDGDRAAGFFGVLATGFALLLGFIVFLAFASYDQSRAGAETEALVVAQQYETAQFLPSVTGDLTGQLVCYGRTVVEQEWPRMEDGSIGDDISAWGVALFQTLKNVEPASASEEAAYAKWLDQTSEREQARQDRVHGAEGIMPSTLWIVLLLSAGVIFVFMLFFADSGERAIVQAMQIGSVVGLMVATLLVIRFLDEPFQEGVGGLRPVAMERTLRILETQLDGVGEQGEPPCDGNGVPQ